MKRRISVLTVACLALAVLPCRAKERPTDKGETSEAKKLKARSSEPKAAEIDASVTLDAMLKKGEKDLTQGKGATVEGYIVQVEKEAEDGDIHVVLAPSKGESDSKKWVIMEITRAWQSKKPSLSLAAVQKLHGSKVQVTGWLYWEPDPDQRDPRGTRWEIHPVTSIAPAGK